MKLIGVSIKRLREEQDMTLRELAKDVGVSPSFLSQVEGGKASPSLATLKSIADQLQTTVGRLIDDDGTQPGDRLVTTERQRKAFKQSGSGIQMYGQEFVLVLKGSLEIVLGDKSYKIKKGDSIYFNSSTPHSFKNLFKGETQALWVVTPPSF